MTKPREYIYNSEYKQAYLVFSKELSFTVAADSWQKFSVDHGLPFAPLLIGTWCMNSDFSPAWDIAQSIPDFEGRTPTISLRIGADETRIYLDFTNNTDSTATFRLRLTGLMNPDFNGESTPFEADKTGWRFDSRWNYPKVWRAGKITEGLELRHDFGYAPQVRIWGVADLYDGTKMVRQIIPQDSIFDTTRNVVFGASTTTNNVKITPLADGEIYYYVFGDEQ